MTSLEEYRQQLSSLKFDNLGIKASTIAEAKETLKVLQSLQIDLREKQKQINSAKHNLRSFIYRPTYSVLLSILFGGVGQIFLGQVKKGIVIIVVAIIGLILFVIPGIIVIFLGMVDAYKIAKRLQHGQKVKEWEFFWTRKAKSKWGISEIVVVGTKLEEDQSPEEWEVDNSTGSCTTTYQRTFSKEWTKSLSIDSEEIHRNSKEIGVKVSQVSEVMNHAESELRKKYVLAGELKQKHESNQEIQVLPYKRVRVFSRWIRVVEFGKVVFIDQYGQTMEMPYNTVVGMKFEQTQRDV